MCGFAGIIKSKLKINDEDLMKMIKPLNHRGPDALTILSKETWGLAHARLKIVDLSDTAGQPMSDHENHWHIVFNGEIYNSEDLKKRYSLDKKYNFKSLTDTEVLLPLLREYGPDFLENLSGIFSFAAFDSVNCLTYLVRDQLGVKPLYYSYTNEGLVFSSEIRSILELKEISKVKNWNGINHYFSLGYFPADETPYQNIFQLLPGHLLKYEQKTNKMEIKSFFNLANIDQLSGISSDSFLSALKNKIENSFKMQMRSDVPIGLMLSGGIDSSIIACLYRKYSTAENFHTYTIKFEEKEFDESLSAKKMADWVKSSHHEILITAKIYRDSYHEALRHFDQPTSDSSFVPTFLLAKRASQDVKVLLSGDGGDEFYAGYETTNAAKWRQRYLYLPLWIRSKFIEPITKRIRPDFNKTSFRSKFKLFVHGAGAPLPLAHFFWRESVSDEVKKQLFKGELANSVDDSRSYFLKKFDEPSGWDDINRQLLLDATYHFTDKLQVKTDRMTMAWSIETRVPLADIELVKFVLAIPGSEKFKKGELKYLLKKAFKDELPEGWTKRKKIGLVAPISKWMKNEWKDWMDEIFIHSEDWADVLNKDFVQKIWLEHRSGSQDWGQVLFTILGYIEWRRIQLR
jgi:asparagine synthase (glutamine-hydrolysing)